ncbi:MAG: M28 family peptidase [Thermoflexales bacterium]|nr:M28 family peptidase [Thermoflexales bacterium]
MPTDTQRASQALNHARFLSEQIGPRGATTPEEKRAADYARDQLQQVGLGDARVETFRSPRSKWLPLTIVFSLAVWGTILCWGSFYLTRVPAIGAAIGAVLCAFSAWTMYRIASYHHHPLRQWLSTATSHTAVAHIAATEATAHQVVLVANVDTAPDSWVFRTPRRTRMFYGTLRLTAVSLVLSVILFVLGGLNAWSFAFISAGLCAFVQSAGILMTIQAEQGDFGAGANDNASGVGVVLALAQQLRETPLKQTEVWIVCAGSHTLDDGGLRAFMQQQPSLAKTAWFIGCQRVGRGDNVAYVKREGWLPRSIRREVRDLIGRTSDRLGQPPKFVATYESTPISAALWQGCRSVCVTMDDQTRATKTAGTVFRLQAAALHQAQAAVWALLQTIDD